jgi:hypothetical protein
MTGLGRPLRARRSLQNKEKLAQSLRTRPPPADTRRACCHVLSSFQRTGLARPPSTGLSTAVRRTFQTYQPANLVSSPNFGLPKFFGPAHRSPRHPLGGAARAARQGRASRRGIRARNSQAPVGRRGTSHAHLQHGARRFLELEGRDARRPLSTWATVRLPLRARHLAASLTNIRPCLGRVNRESRKSSSCVPGWVSQSTPSRRRVADGPAAVGDASPSGRKAGR